MKLIQFFLANLSHGMRMRKGELLMNYIEQTLTSMEVAEMVDKEHKELLRDIRRYCSQLGESKIALTDFFTESTYKTEQNKEMPCYKVTKKGCEFISHKLTGVKGSAFTARYIDRFHEMEDAIKNPVVGMSAMDQIRLIAQGSMELEHRIDDVDKKVGHLENTMNIDYAQQQQLKNFANEVVVKSLGGKKSPAYKYKDDENGKLSSRMFKAFWRDFKNHFRINAYANLPRVKFDEAMRYVNIWEPTTNDQLEIGRINRGETNE